jgi:hypothetical protein
MTESKVEGEFPVVQSQSTKIIPYSFKVPGHMKINEEVSVQGEGKLLSFLGLS